MELLNKCVRYRINQDDDLLSDIAEEIMQSNVFFMLADPSTSKKKWESKNFPAFIKDEDLYAFVAYPDADAFARANGIIMDGTPMIIKTKKETLVTTAGKYFADGLIKNVCIFVQSPVYVSVPCELLAADRSQPEREEAPSREESEDKPLKGVAEAIAVLNTYDNDARKKMPGYATVMNVHDLVSSLLEQNGISHDQFDSVLGLQPGFTANFVSNSSDNTVSKELLKQSKLSLSV